MEAGTPTGSFTETWGPLKVSSEGTFHTWSYNYTKDHYNDTEPVKAPPLTRDFSLLILDIIDTHQILVSLLAFSLHKIIKLYVRFLT